MQHTVYCYSGKSFQRKLGSIVNALYRMDQASTSGTLYTGITNNIKRRAYEHKNHLVPGFTDKYNIDRMLYVETFRDANSAINREADKVMEKTKEDKSDQCRQRSMERHKRRRV